MLRRFRPDDAELLVALHGDPEVMHFIDTGRPVPRSQVLERTLPDFLEEPGPHPGAPLAAPARPVAPVVSPRTLPMPQSWPESAPHAV
ncbi:hypothetical protein ABR737_28230 [Streptomyces sp. Edi2]|uniref:GNAT family N-acetyltransferase n=1 Tax=Streptomyces sp. Edi2 TaxID=3162528 RepID=UPI003305B1CE